MEVAPAVSVIIATRNRAQMLIKAIESVLDQTFQDFEIIVANDGGVPVLGLVASLDPAGRIRGMDHPMHRGIGAARNSALKIARGRLIAYLDDDDRYYPDHLETLVAALETGSHCLAYTDSHCLVQRWCNGRYETVERKVMYSAEFSREALLGRNFIPTLNVAHYKKLLDETGLFDENLECHEDWDLWIRMSRNHSFFHIPKVTAAWTKRTDGSSKTTRERQTLLNSLREVHARYIGWHQTFRPRFFHDQDVHRLELEIAAQRYADAVERQCRLNRYHFVKELAAGKKILDLCFQDAEALDEILHNAEQVVAMTPTEKIVHATGSVSRRKKVRFLCGDVRSLPLRPKAVFDVVLCMETQNGEDQLSALAEEAKNLLVPGGLFVFSWLSESYETEVQTEPGRFHLLNLVHEKLKQILPAAFREHVVAIEAKRAAVCLRPFEKSDETSTGQGAIEAVDECIQVRPEKTLSTTLLVIASDERFEKQSIHPLLGAWDAAGIEKQHEGYLRALHETVGALNIRMDQFVDTLDAMMVQISQNDQTIQHQMDIIAQTDQTSQRQMDIIDRLVSSLDERDHFTETLVNELRVMKNSNAWRMIVAFRRFFYGRLFPRWSRRDWLPDDRKQRHDD